MSNKKPKLLLSVKVSILDDSQKQVREIILQNFTDFFCVKVYIKFSFSRFDMGKFEEGVL